VTIAEKTVLVVEDEPKIAALLRDYLHNEGYATHCFDNGAPVSEWIRENSPDMVLLDLMLPGKDGLSICREVRGFSQVPIIIITAKVEEIDRLLGLELGADDYICKPFSPREVIARVKSVLRRAQFVAENANQPASAYRGITLDEASFRAIIGDTPLELTPVEFRLLQIMMSQPGRVFARGQLMDKVYTDSRVVSDRTMDSHVKNLRQKIAEQMPDAEVIHSVYGVGYRLE
jgi:two-component system response regulator BaeR